ncbi:MAG: proprotein convertase P-domain-containing protein, partial [Saprospiraceae bacterium]
DLSITLTSPSGQSVQLVGPIGFFGSTDFTDWNVTFLPCGDPSVAPDPGFSATWNNNQPWGMSGMYTGSYYPNAGCLQNFSGPVNGTWTLTVVDGQAVDVGNFYNYEIIFCDPSNIVCFSCAANAGNLTQPDLVACEGASSLNMNLPPTYNPPNSVAPPAGEYSYTYMISAFSGGIIQGFDPGPDLSAYPVGVYNVCGVSYLTTDAGNIPSPNGTLTAAQLNTQLNSGQPPFCGNISSNCVKVTINAAPPNVEEFVTICSPDCYTFYNQGYCASGTYVRNLSANNCDYTATLHLTVVNIPLTILNETICQGECSQIPGFESACTQGQFTEVFNSYQDCDSMVRLTLTVLNPIANIVTPAEIACNQASMPLLGTGSSVGGVTYMWTASNGGQLVGPTNTINTAVSSAGDYQLKVCRISGGVSCCDSTSVVVTQNVNPPLAPAAINGLSQVCVGQTFNLSATSAGSGGTYTWTVPAGVTINSGQGTLIVNLTWNSPLGDDVCVTFTNNCGTSPATCLPITVNQPAVPTTPSGPAVVCAGNTEIYTTTLNPNATNYIWTVTAPATIASGQGTNSIIVNWGNVAAGSVCVRETSACGTSQPVCLPVQIGAAPASPTVTGSTVGCTTGVSNYTINTVSGATSYYWQVTGGTITGGNGSTSVQVTWNAMAMNGSVCASAINACDTSAANCVNVTLGAPPAQPVVAGNGAVCVGTNGAYSILPISNATGYTWSVPPGSSMVSGQNTTQLNVIWTAAPGGNICVSANSSCGAGPQACFPVAVTPQPAANAGPGGSVCGTSFNLQAIPSVTGSTGTWMMVPGPGMATFANANNAATTVTVNQSGTYMFIWQEQLNTCTSNDSLTVVFHASPTAGQINRSCDGTNQNYTVTFPVTGGTAPYTIPGGSVSGGVFTSNPIPSGQPYSFQVTDANGCTTVPLTGTFNCSCATNAGTMNLQPLSACAGASITAEHVGAENLDANDVTAFVLHTNSGATLGTVLSQNSTGIFAFQNGMAYETTYYVSFIAGNNLNGAPDPADPCFSVAQGQPVTWHQNPVANAGLDADTCGLTLPLNGNAGTGTWTVVSNPAGGTLTLSNAQSASPMATASLYGPYLLAWTLDNLGCTDADTVQLNFNGSPATGMVATNCDPTNQSYTVTIPLSGGTPPYLVNNNPVAGSSFTSAPIVSGANYSFTLSDANGCTAIPVTGSFVCNCSTQAGAMDLQSLSTCEGGSVTATHLGGQNLDGNDITAYVLHSGNGATLGTVFGQNATATFGFQNGMTYGTTYYISFVVGNNLNGQPDPTDPCLAVSPGQPVTFFQNPLADAGLDADTCGLNLMLNANTGTGQWTVGNAPGGATLSFADDQNPQSAVTASATGTYSLSWTVTANGCVGA